MATPRARSNATSPPGSLACAVGHRPLVQTLAQMQVGTLFLELCTPRAGEIEVLKNLPEEMRIGGGACNQKHAHVESVEHIVAHAERAVQMFGAERVLLTPDCGFATFADNPVSSESIAEAKLAALAQAAAVLRQRHHRA